MVVGTEGWAGKTSVILSSMLSHHSTNGLWEFFFFLTAQKTRDGKRCQLARDPSLLLCAFFNKLRSTSPKEEVEMMKT